MQFGGPHKISKKDTLRVIVTNHSKALVKWNLHEYAQILSAGPFSVIRFRFQVFSTTNTQLAANKVRKLVSDDRESLKTNQVRRERPLSRVFCLFKNLGSYVCVISITSSNGFQSCDENKLSLFNFKTAFHIFGGISRSLKKEFCNSKSRISTPTVTDRSWHVSGSGCRDRTFHLVKMDPSLYLYTFFPFHVSLRFPPNSKHRPRHVFIGCHWSLVQCRRRVPFSRVHFSERVTAVQPPKIHYPCRLLLQSPAIPSLFDRAEHMPCLSREWLIQVRGSRCW